MPDAGFDSGFDSGFDAGSDTGFDAGGICRDVALGSACYPDAGRVIWAGSPSTLPIRIGPDCFCAEELRCGARVVGPHRLSLHLEACDFGSDVLCEECDPEGHLYPAECALPALDAGVWDVAIEGFNVMQLEVSPLTRPPFTIGGTCITPGVDTGCGEAWPWPPTAVTPTEICHRRAIPPGIPVPITLTVETCNCHFYHGPCEVRVDGEDLWVSPTMTEAVCDGACADPVCYSHECTCWTPPLDAGRYRVHAPGSLAVGTLLVAPDAGDSEDVCYRGDP